MRRSDFEPLRMAILDALARRPAVLAGPILVAYAALMIVGFKIVWAAFGS